MIRASVMMIPTCSRCGKVISSEDINVANDVAYYRACNLSHRPFGLQPKQRGVYQHGTVRVGTLNIIIGSLSFTA